MLSFVASAPGARPKEKVMSEEIDHAAECIREALAAWGRLSLTELSSLLGDRKQLLARSLAWLVLRGFVTFKREDNVLFILLPGTASREALPTSSRQ
jgi:hypothetical protein